MVVVRRAAIVLVLALSVSSVADAQTGSVDYLVRLLRESRSERVRSRAAMALGAQHGSDVALHALIAALPADPSPRVRAEVAEALGRLGGDAAETALRIAARTERDAAVLEAIAEAFARVHRPDPDSPSITPLRRDG